MSAGNNKGKACIYEKMGPKRMTVYFSYAISFICDARVDGQNAFSINLKDLGVQQLNN